MIFGVYNFIQILYFYMSFMCYVYSVTHSDVNLANYNIPNIQYPILIQVMTETVLPTTHLLKSAQI